MPRQSKKQKRSAWVPVTAVLLALALAGTVLFSAFREKIDRWEYPQRYEAYVEYYAGKYGIDPMILYAFIRTESNFDPAVDSDAGARGLMQITEVTFDWIKTKIAPTEALTFDDLYDPETNIRFGTYFVSYCLKRYDNHLATAAIWPPPPRPTTAAWAPWTACSGRRRTHWTALRWTITLTRRCGST